MLRPRDRESESHDTESVSEYKPSMLRVLSTAGSLARCTSREGSSSLSGCTLYRRESLIPFLVLRPAWARNDSREPFTEGTEQRPRRSCPDSVSCSRATLPRERAAIEDEQDVAFWLPERGTENVPFHRLAYSLPMHLLTSSLCFARRPCACASVPLHRLLYRRKRTGAAYAAHRIDRGYVRYGVADREMIYARQSIGEFDRVWIYHCGVFAARSMEIR